jgi:hypothetical protein
MTDTTTRPAGPDGGDAYGPVPVDLEPDGSRVTPPPAEDPVAEPPAAGRVMLARDDILAADDRPVEEVEVPEWGGWVLVRGMTGKQRDEYFASQAKQHGKKVVQDIAQATAKIVARCIVDPEDHTRRMFTDRDVALLGERSSAALERVGSVAARLSGLSEEDMEELGKDSESTPSDDTSSG